MLATMLLPRSHARMCGSMVRSASREKELGCRSSCEVSSCSRRPHLVYWGRTRVRVRVRDRTRVKVRARARFLGQPDTVRRLW